MSTTTELSKGFVALIGGDQTAQASAAIYANRLIADGATIGQAVIKAYRLGKRMKSQGFFYKTKQVTP